MTKGDFQPDQHLEHARYGAIHSDAIPGKSSISVSLRSRLWACVAGVGFSLLLAVLAAAPAQAAAPVFPLEAIGLQKISLPASVFNAAQPVYAHDGKHLLFFANVVANGNLNPDPNRGPLHVWIVGTDGQGAHCISCGTD